MFLKECSSKAYFDARIWSSSQRKSIYLFNSEDYQGYVFTFSANGTSLAVRNTTSHSGNWASYVESGYSILELSFIGDTLEEIEDDWRVIEFSETLIELSNVSGGSGEIQYLNFEKI